MTLNPALVKGSTSEPLTHSKAMPISPFRQLFLSWRDNAYLTVKDLRLKAITLLALTLMLRPSDIAPRAEMLDPETKTSHRLVFSRDRVKFHDDGSATVVIFGVKNDCQRTGFDVHLQPHSDPKLDPVKTLQDYLSCTKDIKSTDRAVFLTLRRPHHAIDSSTVAGILEEAIIKAGLGNQGYSAKSFRCTGAMAAIECGVEPHVVMKLGRWKTSEVFYEHYVHSKPPSQYSVELLNHT